MFTCNIRVRFAARDPFSSLKAPVVRIRKNHVHKDIVMRRWVKTRYIETQKREHSPEGT